MFSFSKFILLIKLIFLYLLLYSFIYFLHISFFKVGVVFYSSLLDAFISCVATIFFLYKSKFENFERFLVILILISIGYIISISVPTVIDRSLSIYILEKIDQRGGGIKLNAFPDIFIYEYLPEHRLFDIRITEQLYSGTVVVDDTGCVTLTKKGKLVVSLSSFFRSNLLPKKRLVNSEFTDDLTNPFRLDFKPYEYECSSS